MSGPAAGAASGGREPVAVRRLIERLVASTDPATVFASLVDALVPSVCKAAAVSVDRADTSTGGARRTAHPHTGSDSSTDSPISATGGAVVHISPVGSCRDEPGWFEAVIIVSADGAGGTGDCVDGYTARVSCRWQDPPPGAELRPVLDLLCRQAAALVLQSRHRALLRERDRAVINLQRALISNRTIGAAIGVVTAVRTVSYDQAFELLVAVSRRTNRKIAALAADIVTTGRMPS